MGLLDKVKAQATAATVMAKDAAQKGQAKLDEVQSKKSADGILRDLGAAFYATKTSRTTPSTDSDIDRLVGALQAHESEHGSLTLSPESAAAAPTATTFAPPTATSPSGAPAPAPTVVTNPTSPPPPPAASADPLSAPPLPPTAQTL
jgi:hypothetical protein